MEVILFLLVEEVVAIVETEKCERGSREVVRLGRICSGFGMSPASPSLTISALGDSKMVKFCSSNDGKSGRGLDTAFKDCGDGIGRADGGGES